MSGRSYRPRPYNGSGDSPRPPFLTEFVNQISELALVEPIYRLIGGALRAGVHPHVEGPLRLKTESPFRILELHRAQSQVGQQTVGRFGLAVRHLRKASLLQLDLRPVALKLRFRLQQTLTGDCQRARIFIEPNQTTLCAEAFCYFVAVSAQAHGRVD